MSEWIITIPRHRGTEREEGGKRRRVGAVKRNEGMRGWVRAAETALSYLSNVYQFE